MKTNRRLLIHVKLPVDNGFFRIRVSEYFDDTTSYFHYWSDYETPDDPDRTGYVNQSLTSEFFSDSFNEILAEMNSVLFRISSPMSTYSIK